jgi:hypothetical protein
MVDPEVRRLVANLRPVEHGACPDCGKTTTLYRHLNIKNVVRCISCWKEKRESLPTPPEPVRRVVVEQIALDKLVERVEELEGRLAQVEVQLAETPKRRPMR